MHHRTIIALTLACTAMLASTPLAQAETKPLRVSANGRYFVVDKKVFFWNGDTNWRLYKLNRAEVRQYLDDRKARKFNVIQGPVLLTNADLSNRFNYQGETNTDPTNPNPSWFNHIDYIVKQADKRGMYVALVAAWGTDWEMFGTTSAERKANARAYGKFLGERYKAFNNVIWIVAGEYSVDGMGGDIIDTWKALGQGLNQGSKGRQLITVHGGFHEGQQSSSASYHNEPWLDFNMVHSGQGRDEGPGANNWALIFHDRTRQPTKPVVEGEATYEGTVGWDAQGVRRRAYWAVFSGAAGHTYGAHGVWSSHFAGDDDEGYAQAPWNESLAFEAADDMRLLRRLIESRPMLRRISANYMLVTPPSGVPDHIHVTRDARGRFAMAYIPDSNRSFTIDLKDVKGSTAKAWWFNPRTGWATLIGNVPATGPHTFTTPDSGPDWVLVVDAIAQDYPPPGRGGPLN